MPSELGLDFLRKNQAQYTLAIRKIKFPKAYAKQDMAKITLNVKLYQFANQRNLDDCFETTSKAYHLKNVFSGELDGDGEQFHINNLTEDQGEAFAVGIIIRENEKPIPRVMEKYMNR